MRKLILSIALVAMFFCARSQAQTTTSTTATTTDTSVANLYMAGGSYSSGATPAFAGSALYAHQVNATNTYAFTMIDFVPAGVKPFAVNTNISAGVAQKVATIAGYDIFMPIAAGLTVSGASTGWNYTGGVFVPIKLKPYKGGNFYVAPEARFAKSSVGGSGYQIIVGAKFGWGQ